MCAAIIACCDPPPVFEFPEHVLHFVALFVEGGVAFDLSLPVFPRRNARRDALVLQGFSELIGIIATIREKVFGRWQGIDDQPSAFVIAHLPLWQKHDEGTTVTITDSMEFGVQPAFCLADTAGNAPFLSRLAAVRWALRCVASI